MMRVLIFGGGGMLGHKLVQRLSAPFDVTCTLHGEFASVERFGFFRRANVVENVDVTDPVSIRRPIDQIAPELVINAVGLVKQVSNAGDVERTLLINSIFPHRLAQLSRELGFRMITIGTDCIFSGSRGTYAEDDTPDALDLYGQSKHWGEVVGENCITLRTSIIGPELGPPHGLFEWFLSQRGDRAKGFTKAIFSGFPTLIFADILVDIIEKHRELSGVFHVSSDPISKFELLAKINNRFGLNVNIKEDAELVLDRSLDSSRFREATGFFPQSWDDMIEKMADDPTPYDRWKDRTN